MEELQEKLIPIKGIYGFWKDWANKLEKRESIFKAADFDYTLFSRDKSLSDVPELAENR